MHISIENLFQSAFWIRVMRSVMIAHGNGAVFVLLNLTNIEIDTIEMKFIFCRKNKKKKKIVNVIVLIHISGIFYVFLFVGRVNGTHFSMAEEQNVRIWCFTFSFCWIRAESVFVIHIKCAFSHSPLFIPHLDSWKNGTLVTVYEIDSNAVRYVIGRAKASVRQKDRR